MKGARVAVGEQGGDTEPDGRATLIVPSGSMTLTVTKEGFVAARHEITVPAVGVTVTVALVPTPDVEEELVVVATTRPETMLGDVAVAVNPTDPRYAELVGRTVRLPLANVEIPIIADAYTDPAFGTGAVKITPAHDPNDFDVGQRHQLGMPVVIDEQGIVREEGAS